MGLNSSKASNSAYIYQGMDITIDEDCQASMIQTMDDDKVQVQGNIDCGGGVNIGEQTAKQNVSCKNTGLINAAAMAVSQQTSQATTGLTLGIGDSANANNSVVQQQFISSLMKSNCDSTINQAINGQSYVIHGNITSDGACNILTQNADQQFACLNNMTANLTESAKSSQKATASEGFNLGQILVYLVIAAGIALLGKLILRGAPGRMPLTVEQQITGASTEHAKLTSALRAIE